ncbi:DUF981 family protein [Pseudonocardia alaniniphila]|uniref:DUF981 family protein n=1 Tax=Pseudonocardia alaniniphila TaxID=75291 RepID=A0ABS9TPX8_9PSEU|nr:DUF981 family protein [Pseudonocardia alaniniphila]MCH6170607.1 DUF981 family protein [Pseudonocardia alaniniphila]
MILYNTLVGFCAGIVILTVADVIRRHPRAALSGHGVVLVAVGAPLTVLSAVAALSWPLTVNPPINVAFFEPSLLLGVLALVAATALLRQGDTELDSAGYSRLRPLTWLVFAVGLMLVSIGSAIFSYGLVGDAPRAEPITGRFQGWENSTFGVVYFLAAAGCLAAPQIHTMTARFVMRWSWTVSGAFFLLFSVLNYRTHIGMLVNVGTGSNHQW